MPLPRIRTLLLLLSLLTFLLLTVYLAFTILTPNSSSPSHSSSHWTTTSSFLFPASAIISLSDDNNTFFIARPAAFGPPLPREGLEAELFVLEEGQLACDDTPGWDPTKAHAPQLSQGTDKHPLPGDPEDDGTDDDLNPSLPSTVAAVQKAKGTTTSGDRNHADIESLQQTAEISGKIVLVARGGCGFLEKVMWTQRRGGVALIVGDYKRSGGLGGGLVTMYAKGDTSNVTIPSLFTSHTTAALLTTLLPKPALTSAPADGTTPPPSPPPSDPPARTGLWITLTPTTMTSSPFFDTLLVLVVSPLVTLSVVYTLLLIRSRIRRRRWRAPKSVVDRLPIRTYHTAPTPPRSASFPSPTGSGRRGWLSGASSPPPNAASPVKERFERRGWSGSSECVVCLEEYIDGVSKVMRLPCGHEFHADCITPWLTTRRRTCPICKGDVVRGCREAAATSSSQPASPNWAAAALGLAAAAPSGQGSSARGGVDERTPLVLPGEESESDDDVGGIV